MKSITSFFLILLVVLNVQAGLIIPRIKNIANLAIEKNKELDIDFGGTTKLDVYYDKKDTRNLKPVVVFVHGGSWVIGDKLEYSKIGSLFIKEKYVAVIPNYPLFPKSKVEGMIDDVYRSIIWTYNNISRYGGDVNKITIVGQSSGSHLVALTLLKSTLGIKNPNENLGPLPKIEKAVLFSGPYDFDDYDILNALAYDGYDGSANSFITSLFDSENFSPTNILKQLKSNSISNLGTKKFNFYWGTADKIIPKSSAYNFMEQIRRVSPTTIINYVEKEGQDHVTLTDGARTSKSDMEQLFMQIVRL
ncbi:alpha/beta-hydrolase [Anaeromyces robustus]|jgi:acetyl esterase/lipase|uniref:Alpha/beta-hydrolase n=1 Tax=Anaeromyces robustus TaxID=1754192 RepID=A0A1Y1X2D1_9FUNG|nr:alpha/beta-hydrolase [Anaeromyces robustus]|eukprot:ORX79862.1 alpha/beta-hydrolase [Anaeromyces robustus]